MHIVKEKDTVNANTVLYEAILKVAKKHKLVPKNMEVEIFQFIAVKVLKQLVEKGVNKIPLASGYVLLKDLD